MSTFVTSARYWFERFTPLIAATVGYAVWRYFGEPFPANPEGLFGAAATVAAVLASFMGVSQSIILTIKDTKFFTKLSGLKYDKLVFAYLKSGTYSSCLFALASLAGFFIESGAKALPAFHVVWIILCVYSFGSFARMTSILFKMLSQQMN